MPLEQKRVEAMFEYALSANYLRSLSRELDAKEMNSDQLQRAQILKNVYDRFFCEDASQPIELSNLVSKYVWPNCHKFGREVAWIPRWYARKKPNSTKWLQNVLTQEME